MRVKDVCPLMHRVKCTPWCLTFISKTLWWFVTWLMVVFFREKHRSKNPSHQQPQHTRPQTPPCWKDKTCSWQYLLLWIQKPKALQVRSICHSWEPAETQPVPRKEKTFSNPISGRLATTAQNHWKSSVQPVLQLSWEFGRREKVQEQVALWQQISHLNWDKVQR